MAYIQKSYQKKFGNKDNSMETNIIEDVTYLVEKANNTPAYKVYTALLTQTGTDAPTAIVLENTIGDIVWTRVSDGDYYANLIGGFTINKTAGFLGSDLGFTAKSGGLINWNSYNNGVNVMTFDGNGNPIDDGLLNTFVEIRVYN